MKIYFDSKKFELDEFNEPVLQVVKHFVMIIDDVNIDLDKEVKIAQEKIVN